MKKIGFITDVWKDLSKNFSHPNTRIWRFVSMASCCQKMDIELFIYFRYHVNKVPTLAFCSIIKNNKFIPIIRRMPIVNGCWFYNAILAKSRSDVTKKELFKKNSNILLASKGDCQGEKIFYFSGRLFVVRSIILNDGEAWCAMHKVVAANSVNDVESSDQGNEGHAVEEAFQWLFQQDASSCLKKLNALCLISINFFFKHLSNEKMEVCFLIIK